MNAIRTVLVAVATLLRAALVVCVGYLTVLTFAAWWAILRRRPARRAEHEGHRFAVLVPAHDEERLIGATVDSLLAADYPPDRVTVHVVADNCSDATAEVARQRGVAVHERDDPGAPGKGPALQWLLGRLDVAGSDHDAVVFVDADTLVEPGFLHAVDDALHEGCSVVQGHYGVRDAAATPVIAFRAAALAARNFLRPLGRVTIGGTAGLYGNGMVFTVDALRGLQWSDHLTEDAELQLELLEQGTKVAFAPAARVAAEMPATLEGARTQHARWESGRIDLARRFLPSLVRRAVGGGGSGRVAALDAAMDIAVPPFSVVVAGSTAWVATALAQVARNPTRANRCEVAVATGVAVAQAGYVLSALRMVGAPAAVYRALLQAPRMVVWKVALWTRAVSGRQAVTWVRTARNPDSES